MGAGSGAESDALAEVVAWIVGRQPQVRTIGPDEDLIESRLIDSLSILEFLVLIERISGSPVDLETLDLDSFRSLRRIEQVFLQGAEDSPRDP
ncbi:phosphopantetheine-binding protein [Streptomyces sp. N2-109]|uniref:Phosphopantetheine-binding protein n=1 Tax=Streptomyces gossypii TaxID=2883101 RepID=A0ABT2JSZ6_9ACTN|nr:phosphopantetheine-binding protein [Streptomyces gossypii]MCT2590992.1 phosphopantetheine-binding protein [Streptomyces gossypii]